MTEPIPRWLRERRRKIRMYQKYPMRIVLPVEAPKIDWPSTIMSGSTHWMGGSK